MNMTAADTNEQLARDVWQLYEVMRSQFRITPAETAMATLTMAACIRDLTNALDELRRAVRALDAGKPV